MEIKKNINTEALKTNMIFAFAAQGVSFGISIMQALVVPKFLNVTDYGYWQLFIFFVSYAGFFHFGLNDGLYLKLGGTPYEEMDHDRIGSQLRVSVIFQILLGIFIVVGAGVWTADSDRFFVIASFAVYMVVANAGTFVGFLFQAANKTKIFSIADMIMKIFFICVLVILLILRIYSFKLLILFYIIGLILSAGYYCYWGRKLIFARFCGLKTAVRDIFGNISVGIKLLIANLAGMLILGIGRVIIDHIWGIEHFGQISFSLSLTNFFLMFMYQVSIVLFPALRQIDATAQKRYYAEIDAILSLLLPLILVFYIPIKAVLSLWLPQYAVSLDYLAVLLPLCLFDGKMQLLCTTYFKVLRKEKALLYVNLAACMLSLLLSVIGGYLLKSVDAIVFAMLIGVVSRYVFSAGCLSRYLPGQSWTVLGTELVFAAVFIVVSLKLSALWSFLSVTILYLCYLFSNRAQMKTVRRRLLRR
ncbi:MAG TPA: hypothetical protein PKD52_11505 [Clostridiales bacterium]|nr:hypothetical protein [Clostridiales bacterium]